MAMEHNFTVITKSALTFVFSVLFYYFQNKMQIFKMIFINKGCGNDFYSFTANIFGFSEHKICMEHVTHVI